MNYLVDVNVWLAIALIGHVHQKQAKEWFDSVDARTIAFCRMTQNGFLRLLTNSHVMRANVMTASEAWKTYDAFYVDSRIQFLHEPTGVDAIWRTQTAGYQMGPNYWTDAYLAAFASAADFTLLTFDRGFARRKGLNVRILTA